MAYHLEANPKAKATFNFVPVLLDQLEDYEEQFLSGHIRDPLLAMLARENLEYLNKEEINFINEHGPGWINKYKDAWRLLEIK